MSETCLVSIPQETVNDESVRILLWKVASGSTVDKGQLICEVETSKAVMEICAPVAGIVEYFSPAGAEIPVGATICHIVPPKATMKPAPAAAGKPELRVPEPDALIPDRPAEKLPPARFTRLAIAAAEELGINHGSFAPGTLVRKIDILRKAGKLPPEDTAAPEWPSPATPTEKNQQHNAPVAGVPVDWSELPRRKTLESRILGSGRDTSIQSSVTAICRASKLRARASAIGLATVGPVALMVFEVARLLRKYPVFNAVHDRGRMGQYGAINIGWAIDGGQGLMVPVIPHADQKGLAEIAEIMERHIESYIGNSLAPSDFLGGTFTVSDLTGDGISFFEPLISQGQSAILGIGSDQNGAGGELFYLTLSFDHQVTEGKKAAQFIRELSQRLETHAGLQQDSVESKNLSGGEQYCVICQRDSTTLRSINAILLKSEIPPGSVCSLCLGGW